MTAKTEYEKAMERYEQLYPIFRDIHRRFIYTPDEVVWNKEEHWENESQIPDEGPIYGDCDCFALACRKECRKLGIPSRLVFCAVEVRGDYVGHLVLESDGWILCNNQYDVMMSQDLNYLWLWISGYEKGDDWHVILDDPELYKTAMGK